jgi:hypothetical protein
MQLQRSPKDQLSRDFWGYSIFDFCSNICHLQTPDQPWHLNAYSARARSDQIEMDRALDSRFDPVFYGNRVPVCLERL